MKIELNYDALDEIVTASLYDSYRMHYSELLHNRQRLAEKYYDYIAEDMADSEEILAALKRVLFYYDMPHRAEDKIAEIEKAVEQRDSIHRYERMLKRMGRE